MGLWYPSPSSRNWQGPHKVPGEGAPQAGVRGAPSQSHQKRFRQITNHVPETSTDCTVLSGQSPASASGIGGAVFTCCRLSETRFKYFSVHERWTYSSRTRNHRTSSLIG